MNRVTLLIQISIHLLRIFFLDSDSYTRQDALLDCFVSRPLWVHRGGWSAAPPIRAVRLLSVLHEERLMYGLAVFPVLLIIPQASTLATQMRQPQLPQQVPFQRREQATYSHSRRKQPTQMRK